MKTHLKLLFIIGMGLSTASCVTKKKFTSLQNRYDTSVRDLVKCGDMVQDYKDKLAGMTRMQQESESQKNMTLNTVQQRDMQIDELKLQTKVSELKSALIIYFACLAKRAYFFPGCRPS